MIVSRFPYPLDKGDKLRAFYQLRELSKNFNVTLFAISDQPVDEKSKNIVSEYCDEVHVSYINLLTKVTQMGRSLLNGNPFQIGYFYSFKAQNSINSILKKKEFKHIYCQLIRTTEYVKNTHHIPKTLDYMDALSTGIERRIEKQPFYKKWLFKSESKRLSKYERSIFDFFEHKTIISEQDRALIKHPDRDKIICIPNGIDQSFFEEINIKQDHDFVFVGNMSYPPNIEAVYYIHDNILPNFPDSKLLVSGSSPHSSLKDLESLSSQITLTGWVDDIRESYCRGKIFLAPMMIGTGMQNKLLEAMALGVPCITTPLANNAIKAKHKSQILEGSTKEELNALAKQLLTNNELQHSIGQEGKQFVKENYGWETSTSELVGLMD